MCKVSLLFSQFATFPSYKFDVVNTLYSSKKSTPNISGSAFSTNKFEPSLIIPESADP